MLALFARNWWALALRGAATILFGLMAFLWPRVTLDVLIFLFGVYAFFNGTLAITLAIIGAEFRLRCWPILLAGLLSIIAGLMALALPVITAVVLLWLIAGWAMLTGLFEMITAFRLRHEIAGEWRVIFVGLLTFLFGVVLVLFPGEAMRTMVWLIGFYALLYGVTLLILAWRLRRFHHRHNGQFDDGKHPLAI